MGTPKVFAVVNHYDGESIDIILDNGDVIRVKLDDEYARITDAEFMHQAVVVNTGK